jgi:hypothetical protein
MESTTVNPGAVDDDDVDATGAGAADAVRGFVSVVGAVSGGSTAGTTPAAASTNRALGSRDTPTTIATALLGFSRSACVMAAIAVVVAEPCVNDTRGTSSVGRR